MCTIIKCYILLLNIPSVCVFRVSLSSVSLSLFLSYTHVHPHTQMLLQSTFIEKLHCAVS